MSVDIYLKRIVKGAGFIMVGLLLSKLFIYSFRILIARGLGVEDYGDFNLGMAISEILGVIALAGLSEGIVRYISYYQGREDFGKLKGAYLSGLILSAVLSIFSTVLLWIFSDYIAVNFFSNPNFSYVLKIFSFAIPLNVIGKIYLAALRATQNIQYVVYAQNIISTFTRLLFAALAIYFGLKLSGVIWAYNFSVLVMLLFAYYYIKKKVKIITDRKIKPSFMFKRLLMYSWPLLFTYIIYDLLHWTDSLMIGYFENTNSVGIYNSAAPTANLVQLIPSALILLFLPIESYLSQNNKMERNYLFDAVTRWIITINLPLTLLLMVFSRQFIKFFFGLEFITATIPLIVLSLGQFFYSASLTSREILKSVDKTKLILYISAFTVIANIVLNAILISLYGITGAAIATTISYLLMSVLFAIWTYTSIKLNSLKLEYSKQIFSSVILLLPLIYLVNVYDIKFYLVVLISIAYLLIYTLSLFILKVFKQEDYIIFNAVKNRIIR